MTADAFALLNAGTETTSHAMVVITWALLNNPQMVQRLQAELKVVMPSRNDTVGWAELEELPYLVSKASEDKPPCQSAQDLTKRSAPSSERVSASPTALQDTFHALYPPQVPSSADGRYPPAYMIPPT